MGKEGEESTNTTFLRNPCTVSKGMRYVKKREDVIKQMSNQPTKPANQLSGLMASVHDYCLACYVYPLFPRYALDGIKRTHSRLSWKRGGRGTRDPHTSLGCVHTHVRASRTGEKQKSRENRGGGQKEEEKETCENEKQQHTWWSRGDVLERDISFISRETHQGENQERS